MRKLNLSEWAALAEVISGVAVVVSLLIVAYTVQQNTIALQSGKDDAIYQAVRELHLAQSTSPGLAQAIARLRDDGALDETQQVIWEKFLTLQLNIWENVYIHGQNGLIDDEDWRGWDDFFVANLSDAKEGLPRETWMTVRDWYVPDFASHVETRLYGEELAAAALAAGGGHENSPFP